MYMICNQYHTIDIHEQNFQTARKIARETCKKTKEDIWIIDYTNDVEMRLFEYHKDTKKVTEF